MLASLEIHRDFLIILARLLVTWVLSEIEITSFPLQLDATVTIQQYGFVVAADAFGQMIFSPIFGFLADKCGSIRPVCLLCCIVFTLGNVLYATISFSQTTQKSLFAGLSWFLPIKCKKLQCTSLFKWCIVLGFSEPKRRLCKVPLVTADAWYYYLAIRSSCRFRSFWGFATLENVLGCILHMPKLVSFHLLRNWCIMYACFGDSSVHKIIFLPFYAQ